METDELHGLVIAALEDAKALEVRTLDVRGMTSITDLMVIATGTSDRHVRAVAGHVVDQAKQAGQRPIGVEGEADGDWVLVDLADVVVHIMRPDIRGFYNLEKLWGEHDRAEQLDHEAQSRT